MKQRKSEWLNLSESTWNYHRSQFSQPYRSTIKFIDWLYNFRLFNDINTILDVGCGCGSNIFYMVKRFPSLNFTGTDINNELIEKGNSFFKNKNLKNCRLIKKDLYKLDNRMKNKYDGIISFQTLSWLPEYKTPLTKLIELNPKWIAISSLFYEGPVSCKIEIQYLDEQDTNSEGNKRAYYNIYSLDDTKKFFKRHGYQEFKYIPFNIDIDLMKPKNKGMGTYTEKLENGKRIQISGPLLLPWYFIFVKNNLKEVK